MRGEFNLVHEAPRSPVFNKALTVQSHIMPKAKKKSVKRKPKIAKPKDYIKKHDIDDGLPKKRHPSRTRSRGAGM